MNLLTRSTRRSTVHSPDGTLRPISSAMKMEPRGYYLYFVLDSIVIQVAQRRVATLRMLEYQMQVCICILIIEMSNLITEAATSIFSS
jgi:hypothetical protein